jgi:glycosyltransferase involved in cell wall biosynthesis
MDNTFVTVIMGVYNEREDWLREAIESVINQTYSNFEFLILLDNPNNGKLEQVIREYEEKDERVKFSINEKNLGLVKTLNKGIDLAKGRFIARMDADDICHPKRIEEQVKYLERNKDVVLVATNIDIINEEGSVVRSNLKIINDYKQIRHLLKFRNFFYHPTFMFRKEIVNKIGCYREIPFAEDYDLVCRLASSGMVITNIKAPLLKYRIRQNSITLSNKSQQMRNSIFVQHLYKQQLLGINDNFDKLKDNIGECSYLDELRFNIRHNVYRIEKRFLTLIEIFKRGKVD